MSKRPNIIFVLTDDQGYGDLGCTGNDVIKTPNIDALYNESTRLTNFHVGPTCAPTRAGLMTGHYANSTGVWHTVGGRSLLRKNEWTIASALKEDGYNTGIFGKWHLGDASPYQPHERGFDIAIVHGGGGISQTPDFWGNDYFDDTYFVNGKPQKFQGYCTDVFFGEAKKFIKENKDNQFFCYLALNAPHGPFNVENKYSEKYKGKTPDPSRANFYGMIENIDENLGKLRQFVKDEGIYENTIFMFMTDNGTACGIHTDGDGFVRNGYNAGLRGGKCSKYDGGHRVPFFMHYPDGGLNKPADLDDITANVDFMPTLLDMCGVSKKPTIDFHGISLKDKLYGKDVDFSNRVIVTDSQRLVVPIKWKDSAVCSNKWRLIDGVELYDAVNDREQRNDISSEHKDVVETLRAEYDKWWDIVSKQAGEQIPIDINENLVTLTSHDIINPQSDTAWEQGRIRSGHICAGYYDINVVKSGKYNIELRRWAREVDEAICKEIDPENDVYFEKEFISEHNWNIYSGSTAISIHTASLRIQSKLYSEAVTSEDKFVSFDVDLVEGLTTMEALFWCPKDVVVSPYYVYVSPVDKK